MHACVQVPIILLTNDAANRAKALSEGLTALGVMPYCRQHHAQVRHACMHACTRARPARAVPCPAMHVDLRMHVDLVPLHGHASSSAAMPGGGWSSALCVLGWPRVQVKELQDMVAASAQDDDDDEGAAPGGADAGEAGPSTSGSGSGRGAKRRRLYADHKPYSELMAGIKEGRFHQVRAGTRAVRSTEPLDHVTTHQQKPTFRLAAGGGPCCVLGPSFFLF